VTDVTFIPTFHHVDWVDNRDRVQAGGPNGFNIHFSSIETDLNAISGVVAALDTAIDALGQKPPPVQQKLSLAPTMVTLDPPGWSYDTSGNAYRPSGTSGVSGILTVPLPDGIQLVSLRALGQNTGAGILTIGLFRSPLAGSTSPPDLLVRVYGNSNPYDVTFNIDSSMSQVDMSTYRYFLIAACSGTAASDVVTISAFQITYLPG
jgi:hypothetical protein